MQENESRRCVREGTGSDLQEAVGGGRWAPEAAPEDATAASDCSWSLMDDVIDS